MKCEKLWFTDCVFQDLPHDRLYPAGHGRAGELDPRQLLRPLLHQKQCKKGLKLVLMHQIFHMFQFSLKYIYIYFLNGINIIQYKHVGYLWNHFYSLNIEFCVFRGRAIHEFKIPVKKLKNVQSDPYDFRLMQKSLHKRHNIKTNTKLWLWFYRNNICLTCQENTAELARNLTKLLGDQPQTMVLFSLTLLLNVCAQERIGSKVRPATDHGALLTNTAAECLRPGEDR